MTKLTNYSGDCRGGPYDGQRLIAERKSYRVAIAEPINWAKYGDEIPPDVFLNNIEFGHYNYVLGQWIWRKDGYHAHSQNLRL